MTRDEMTLAEWLDAHAGVVEAGIIQGDLCSRDFARYDVRKIREAAKLLAERDALAAEIATLKAERDQRATPEEFKALVADRDYYEAREAQIEARRVAVLAEIDAIVTDEDDETELADLTERLLPRWADTLRGVQGPHTIPLAAPVPSPVTPPGEPRND